MSGESVEGTRFKVERTCFAPDPLASGIIEKRHRTPSSLNEKFTPNITPKTH